MSKGSVNKVIIVGNCGQDPETKYMPSGGAVTNISIATSEAWKDKQTGQPMERTEWHRITFYGRLAEISGEYLRKGSKVYVEGALRTRKWQDQQGMDRYTTEIIANEMQMLDSRSDAGGAQQRQNSYGAQQGGGQQQPPHTQSPANYGATAMQSAPPPPKAQPQSAPPAASQPPNQGTPPPGDMDGFDDDIPF